MQDTVALLVSVHVLFTCADLTAAMDLLKLDVMLPVAIAPPPAQCIGLMTP